MNSIENCADQAPKYRALGDQGLSAPPKFLELIKYERMQKISSIPNIRTILGYPVTQQQRSKMPYHKGSISKFHPQVE